MGQPHKVVEGECLASIAQHYGFKSYKTIWEHADNQQLRSKRPSPNLIYPGDIVVIPDRDPKTVDKPTDQQHQFVVKAKPTNLVIKVMVDMKPVANAQYELKVGNRIYHDSTDGDGVIQQPIDPCETKGALKITDPPLEWDLMIGSLDPVEEVKGVQQRLNNLGYFCGDADGVSGPRTRGATRQFQAQNNITPNGTIDDATRTKLKSLHDGE